MRISSLDRRKFLRGSGVALALPWFESFNRLASAASSSEKRKRLACFYLPDGVPMPLANDPSFKEWSWFPHGSGKDFTLTKCMETLEPLRQELTVFSGLSNPAVRRVHGHANADQFLTGAETGADGDYQNTISLDQEFAAHAGNHTRHSFSLSQKYGARYCNCEIFCVYILFGSMGARIATTPCEQCNNVKIK